MHMRVVEAHARLLRRQALTLRNPSTTNAARELDAQRKWDTLVRAEESFLYQKSRVSWMSEGDRNSAYFHRIASSRRSYNTVLYIDNEHGERFDTQQNIQEHCLDYFTKLLGRNVSPTMMEQYDMNLILTFRCTQVQRKALEAKFSNQEIKEAFLGLPRNKSPGPDGYTAEFFKHNWNVIGAEVTEAVGEFFKTGNLLKQWNSTSLVLIPKKPNACRLTEFRPISCLNTVYKVVAKLLTKRLKTLLPAVISPLPVSFPPEETTFRECTPSNRASPGLPPAKHNTERNAKGGSPEGF